MTYSISDCIQLRPLLEGAENTLSYYNVVLVGLRDIARERCITQLDVEDVFRRWLDRYVGTNAIFNFIFRISLDDVPMYMNDPDLKLFVKWRFRIAK